ncbi:MAG TPA: RDD family protein, partial [Acidimicrobiales bacterium]|nr:RDD family protein [Acidimicrobiales bacterium]
MVLDTLLLAVPIAAAAVWLERSDATGLGWPTREQISFATIDVVPPRKELVFLVAALTLVVVYFGLLNGSNRGMTLGAAVTGIAIRRESSGRGLGLPRSFLRCLFRLVLYGGLPALALVTADRPL